MTTGNKRANPAQIALALKFLGHTLSPEQEALIYCDAREILGGGGERAGKSFVAAEYFNARWWEGRPKENALYWVAAKDYDRCHAEMEYIIKAMLQLEAAKPENIHTPQHAQWSIKLSHPDLPNLNTVIKSWSLQDWLKVGSEAPDGIIVCEVAQISLAEYNRLTDRTAEKRGWLVGTGTFESSLGWYPEKWKQYQLPGQPGKSFSLPSWSNRKIYPGGENDPEIVRLRNSYASNPEYFLERFGGIPSPPKGLVFPEFRYLKHVKELKMDDSPVYLWIDPGYAGAYAVEAVQVSQDTVYVVDEVYEQGLVTEQIIDICLQRPWWKLVRGGAVDIAARQHQAMPAVAEVWAKKAQLHLASNRVEEAQGRDRLKTFLNINPIDHQPRFFVDPKAKGLLSEFGACPNPFTGQAEPYRWKQDRNGAVVGQEPEDRNNHGIKAVVYGLIDRFGYVTRTRGRAKTSSYI